MYCRARGSFHSDAVTSTSLIPNVPSGLTVPLRGTADTAGTVVAGMSIPATTARAPRRVPLFIP